MNTAYNSTTTATDVTTTTTQTQQPEPVATPDEVTTEYYGYLDGRDPMQIGRIKKQLDRRIYADGKICTWAEYIAEGYEAGQLKAYKDEYTYDKKGRDLAYHEHKVTEWVIWTAREIERGNGVVANKTIVDYARYLIKLMETTPATAPQATEEDTVTDPETTAETPVQEHEGVTTTAPEVVTTATDDATVFRNAIEEYGNLGSKYLESLDYTQATEQVYNTKRGNTTKVTERYYTMKDGTTYGLYRRYNKNGKRARFEVYQDGRVIESRTYGKNNNSYKAEVKYCGGKLCYQVEEGKVTSVEYYEGKRRHYHIVFDDTNRPETPRDLPAPAPSKATKEAPATEENVPSKSRRQIIDEMIRTQQSYPVKYWPLLAKEISDKTGGQLWNVPKFGNVVIPEKNLAWYFRYYNYLKTQPARDIEAIEDDARKLRAQLEKRIKSGKKSLYYEAETFRTAEEYMSVIIELYSTKARKDGNISEVEMYDIIGEQIRYAIEKFDKPGDRFPAIANMSTEFRNVTSTYNNIKSVYDANHTPAPTPEPIDTPEEVQEVTTSKQEDDTTPYWLLLDNELREQEIDLEIAKEEAAVLAMEKEQEEAAANVEFLTGPELDKAIAEYIERNGLDLKLEKGYYYFYITTDGYIVKLNKNKPRKDLYIPDEGPFYESYKKGEVTDRSIFFSHNLETLDDYERESMKNVNYCRVERTKDGTLSISTNNLLPEYECDKETGAYKEIPVKHPTPRELAVYVAAWNAYEADQRERLEKYWKRYSDKVCVNTYWANR